MKHITNFFMLFFASAALCISCSKDNSSNTLGTTDTNFMQMAAHSNLAEIDLAKFILTTSPGDSVSMFAQMMISDHTKAMMGLDSLASQYNVTLPTTVDSMHAALKAQLMNYSGSSLDSAYIKSQVTDHVNAINLFQNEANGGVNQNVKTFASKSLPVLDMHLQRAQSIASLYP